MDNEILRDCRQYIIKAIFNPHTFLMIPCEKEKSYRNKVKRLEKRLATRVVKVPCKRKIPNGIVVAIKNKSGFQRGLVQDFFSKHSEMIYSMLLVDYGTTVTIPEEKVYYINDHTLRDKTLGLHNVFLHDIAPATIEIECYPSITFKKRECEKWSSHAHNFVNSLLSINSFVFLKTIVSNPSFITGEIYFLMKPEDKLVSLGELLCSKNFAIKSPKMTKSFEAYMEGEISLGEMSIEEDIPINTLIQETCDKLNSYKIEEDWIVTRNSSSADQTTSSVEYQEKFKENPSSALTLTTSEGASKGEDILHKIKRERSPSPDYSKFLLSNILKARVERELIAQCNNN